MDIRPAPFSKMTAFRIVDEHLLNSMQRRLFRLIRCSFLPDLSVHGQILILQIRLCCGPGAADSPVAMKAFFISFIPRFGWIFERLFRSSIRGFLVAFFSGTEGLYPGPFYGSMIVRILVFEQFAEQHPGFTIGEEPVI